MEDLRKVLTRLGDAGLQVNPLKCFWVKNEVDYLGFIITTEGIKPQPKKIAKILAIKRPKNKRQLRRFVGMINYYKDM